MDDLDNDFFIGKFDKALLDRFYRSLYVCFYNDSKFF